MWLALALLLVLALASGAGLAFAALGDGQRPVSAFRVLANLLGPHLLTLLGWALGPLAGDKAVDALDRPWLRLNNRLARNTRVTRPASTLLILFGRRRLARWGLDTLVHGLQPFGLLTVLTMFLGLLAARRYGFIWETTILGSDTFITFTQVLDALPALFGFPLPDAEPIRASGDAALIGEAVRYAWVGRLAGALSVYRVLPYVLLSPFYLWRWERGLTDLDLGLDDPSYSLLRECLVPVNEHLGISDAVPDQLPEPQGGQSDQETVGVVLVAVELDDRRPRPPKSAESVAGADIFDGGQQRCRLFERLTRYPPAHLAITYDPYHSPGCGTPALLGELTRYATSTCTWLLQASPGEALDNDRPGDWYATLERLQLPHGETSPLARPETDHD